MRGNEERGKQPGEIQDGDRYDKRGRMFGQGLGVHCNGFGQQQQHRHEQGQQAGDYEAPAIAQFAGIGRVESAGSGAAQTGDAALTLSGEPKPRNASAA